MCVFHVLDAFSLQDFPVLQGATVWCFDNWFVLVVVRGSRPEGDLFRA